jgi:DNA-binding NtrC family response regulator
MLASKKILIADDDHGAGAALAARLRILGCDVLPMVKTLDEAGDLAVRELPSVALIAMTLVDGMHGGLADVRGRFATPVIFIAPNPGAGPAAGLAVTDYLQAGCDDRELLLVLSGAWSRAQAESRAHELEAQLQEEQAFGDLGRVAGKVAHKFNNLLMAVTSGVALVRMDSPADAPTLPHLDKIDHAVERAAELCRQLLAGVRRESGALAVLDDEGGGDIAKAVERTSAPPKRAGIHGAVLIVDDDESVRALARWVVERAGYPAVTARDGDEALEQFRADPGAYGLVLLDLTMPRMSGEEVLVGLRSIRPNIPVVVITGYGEDAVRDSEREGIAGFLQKPFSPDALRAMLQRCAV